MRGAMLFIWCVHNGLGMGWLVILRETILPMY